jgi:hypothetical protein
MAGWRGASARGAGGRGAAWPECRGGDVRGGRGVSEPVHPVRPNRASQNHEPQDLLNTLSINSNCGFVLIDKSATAPFFGP